MNTITKCYLLEEDTPQGAHPLKICQTRQLAEEYKKMMEPLWERTFSTKLRIVTQNFYMDAPQNQDPLDIQNIIKTAVETERTHLGKSVLSQLADQLGVQL